MSLTGCVAGEVQGSGEQYAIPLSSSLSQAHTSAASGPVIEQVRLEVALTMSLPSSGSMINQLDRGWALFVFFFF